MTKYKKLKKPKNFLKFPKNFLWGAAYSAHQVEGNNKNNDWWEWEQKGKTVDKSGWACDSWNRYLIDHQLAEELGLKAFRLSLEWSRIEPEEGIFSEEAIAHYRKVLQDLKRRKIKRVVTLWHWPLPLWLTHNYKGWHRKETIKFFSRYCQRVVEELGDEIDIFLTMNEPRMPLNKGYLTGEFPPGKHNPFLFLRARKNMIEAHRQAYKLTKKLQPKLPVSLTQYTNDFEFSQPIKFFQRLTQKIESWYNWYFYLKAKDHFDFVGINYYTGFKFQFKRPFFSPRAESMIFSDMHWGFSPVGIYEITMDAHRKFGKPIYILENGAADATDKIRAEYIQGHLKWLHRAIQEGAEVKGYFYWALIDNFEWQAGFGPRFGLCEMNYETMERKPRPSFYYYQRVIKEQGVTSLFVKKNEKKQNNKTS